MHGYWLIAGTVALAAFTAGCENRDAGPGGVAAPTQTPEPMAASRAAADGDCPFAGARNKDWAATIDRTPPIPDGGRPLAIRGMVEAVENGRSVMITPSELDAAARTQHFLVETVADATAEKGWRQISTGAYPAPEGVTRAVVDCGGKVLAEVEVTTMQ
jgi:hypothetical protein